MLEKIIELLDMAEAGCIQAQKKINSRVAVLMLVTSTSFGNHCCRNVLTGTRGMT